MHDPYESKYYRVIRPLMVSVGLALAISGLALVLQVLVWLCIPPLTDVSFSVACAPHHALKHSAVLFLAVFASTFFVYLFKNWQRVFIRADKLE
jgi:hypothetical protein